MIKRIKQAIWSKLNKERIQEQKKKKQDFQILPSGKGRISK